MRVVLDASALLAFLHEEPGADRVHAALDGAAVSAVNWAEVVQKSLEKGVDVAGLRSGFADLGVAFEPFDAAQAEIAAELCARTRAVGLSLADRACLALALHLHRPVLTADRTWAELNLDAEVQLLR